MLLLRSLLFDLFLYGLILVLGILGAPFAAFSSGGAHAVCRLYCDIILWLLAAICGLRTEVRGVVPQGDVIVCAKHQSFLDILILFRALPRARFIMKKELRWAPIFGFYATRIGSTPVARGAKARAMRDMVAHVERTESEAGQLVIYPQGTRVAPGAARPYKIGAGVLYERFGKTCVPAATNAGVFWGRKSFLRRPGLAVVEFLAEVPAGLPVPDFMARIEAEIEAASDALASEAGFAAPPVAA